MITLPEGTRIQLLTDYSRVNRVLEDCLIEGEDNNFQVVTPKKIIHNTPYHIIVRAHRKTTRVWSRRMLTKVRLNFPATNKSVIELRPRRNWKNVDAWSQ